ncbi:permease [Floricoccus penangensis]|uniref:Permease n=1 Tax=Floricoccus penangensis TaxID=1859475 RepID=A0A9Q5JHW7_9LACT|nr:DMT family transporter [Floricoccus penangensis]OFI47890.1 permease [Floricoccus penangensis]
MGTKNKGIFLALLACSLWAISGISGQILFEDYGFTASWVVTARTVISGILLLLSAKFIFKEKIFEIFKNKRDLIDIIIFSFAGMFMLQFAFFKTIELSNSALATILQYTCPFFIIIYEAIKNKKMPSAKTFVLLFATSIGVLLIVTKGNISNLITSFPPLFWGIMTAVSLAIYSIQPQRILKKYSTILVVGWGMIIAGIPANIVHPLWKPTGVFNFTTIGHLTVVIILGTLFAYLVYLSSVKYISPALAGVLTAWEPILSNILSIFVFSHRLTYIEIIGFILVIVSIAFLQKDI